MLMKKFSLNGVFALLLLFVAHFSHAQSIPDAPANNPKYNFLVHVTAFGSIQPANYFATLKDVYRQVDDKGIYHYYLGGFATLEEAENVKKETIAKGFKYAYVVDVQKLRRECKVECDKDPVEGEMPEPIRAARGIRHLFFDYDRATLRADSKQQLNKLAVLMKQNPEFKVEFRGHADGKGSDNYNQQLSERRSKEAKNYLSNKSITADRVAIKGFGSTNPIAKNEQNGQDTPAGRKFNRRVELLIMDAEGNVLNAYVEPIAIPTELMYGN